MRDSGIRLDSSDCSSTSSSILPLTPLERLIRTHPIWFLPEVDRDIASNILHMKETGVQQTLSCLLIKTIFSEFLGAPLKRHKDSSICEAWGWARVWGGSLHTEGGEWEGVHWNIKPGIWHNPVPDISLHNTRVRLLHNPHLILSLQGGSACPAKPSFYPETDRGQTVSLLPGLAGKR